MENYKFVRIKEDHLKFILSPLHWEKQWQGAGCRKASGLIPAHCPHVCSCRFPLVPVPFSTYLPPSFTFPHLHLPPPRACTPSYLPSQYACMVPQMLAPPVTCPLHHLPYAALALDPALARTPAQGTEHTVVPTLAPVWQQQWPKLGLKPELQQLPCCCTHLHFPCASVTLRHLSPAV